MLDMIRKLMKGEEPEVRPLGPDEAQVAVAALLVEAARADGEYHDAERAMIDRVLARRFTLDDDAAARVRRAGEEAQDGAADLVRFTRAVKDSVPHEERFGVIEALWEVIYSDGVNEAREAALVRKLAGLLYVEDRDAGIARRRVAERLGLE